MPTHFEPPEGIEPIEKIGPKKPIKAEDPTATDAPSKVKFDEAVQKADSSRVEQRPVEVAPEKIAATTQTEKPSLLALAAKGTEGALKIGPTTPTELAEQAEKIRHRLERPRARLMRATEVVPHDALPKEVATELNGHIEHMDKSLRDASRVGTGVELGSAIDYEKPPMVRFLNYLTDSDRRLQTFVSDLKGLDLQKRRLQPSDMMAIQIKLGFIQNELEFFTATLNKALESIKTVFNVQI